MLITSMQESGHEDVTAIAADPGSGRVLLSTAEVARRLGVKPQTVYAYVSRGLLSRHESSSHRRSLFAADEVERASDRARRPSSSGALEVVIETQLTSLDPDGRLHYRGRDVTELARFRSFEDVAGLLWDGDPLAPWLLADADRQMIAELRPLFAATTPASDLIPVAVAALAAADEHRGDRRPDAVRGAAARMLAGTLEVVGVAGAGAPGPGPDRAPASPDPSATAPDPTAAGRVWSAMRADGRRPRPAQLAALNAALVLLADHELAASTLAARVAASAWADPYRVVLAGLGPLGGSLHGGASLAVEALLNVDTPVAAFSALERQVATGVAPGFGHRVYRYQDPRAVVLLERLPAVADDKQALLIVEATLEAARALDVPSPNVDFALAALAKVMGLRPAAASTIFTIARLVGLIAHALEEYPHRLRFRPRATYVGPVPR
jgi:citrate synthase